ncbi:IS3 family transposase [Bacillus sp. GX]|uniref:IS3 family transposase n=1 Tax=Bacillus TaxID=1386 RepID=UPI001419AEB8|nr:IS3 family transposase [Bacillus albus]MBU5220228.1 IS3 family transposase [Bacillus albus]HDR7719413.1 IS3 family transposase [Bacillus albus]
MLVWKTSSFALRKECFHLHSFRKANEVKLAVRKYMYFYNHQRFQKKLKRK